MERKTRSMRGEVVNFDLFAIKEAMSVAPEPSTIKPRENFIKTRKRRGSRKILDSLLADEGVPSVDSSEIDFSEEAPPVAAKKPRKIVKKTKE